MKSTEFQHNGKTYEYHRFDGMTDVMTAPLGAKVKARYANTFETRVKAEWHGIDLPANEILQLFVNGWVDGVKKLRDKSEEFSLLAPMSPSKVTRPRYSYGDEGDMLDTQRYLQGDVENMWQRLERRTMADLKTRIHIVVNGGGSAATKGEELQWPGIVAAALAARAIDNGYDVKISSVSMNAQQHTTKSPMQFHSVCLKTYDSNISLANLAPVMLPAMFRVVGFRQFFAAAGKRTLTEGLGYSQDIDEPLARAAMGSELDDGTLIMVPRIRNEKQAINFYIKSVKSLEKKS